MAHYRHRDLYFCALSDFGGKFIYAINVYNINMLINILDLLTAKNWVGQCEKKVMVAYRIPLTSSQISGRLAPSTRQLCSIGPLPPRCCALP
ncbi:hypothetical protein NLM33_34220 [Bradyrhizobium sp. CCGUVB1N3]|uniref:hypothetical protein n=1 Tax=Bradyrhizobium sp. CCGUVB1N3 TaxID=2949629 RepID=UPI0020B246FF|nr:hypothetical protein [Bradyrhizobium sp. CCGUVB1N3]MCP3475380.1 hypothetical protein [Bradyrhizobium sp. CCGUVB1N3]